MRLNPVRAFFGEQLCTVEHSWQQTPLQVQPLHLRLCRPSAAGSKTYLANRFKQEPNTSNTQRPWHAQNDLIDDL